MKITQSQLRKIIKEEIRSLNESSIEELDISSSSLDDFLGGLKQLHGIVKSILSKSSGPDTSQDERKEKEKEDYAQKSALGIAGLRTDPGGTEVAKWKEFIKKTTEVVDAVWR